MRRRSVMLAIFGSVLFLQPCSLLGQQVVSGSISGIARDSTGAVAPGVRIMVRNAETGVTRATQTDSSGHYLVSSLVPGGYEVQAELAGFQKEVRRGITLTLGREAVVDFSLRVGQVQEQVEVTGEAPLVDTSSATLAGLVDQKQVTDLPLNGRSLTQLTTLQPGVLFYRSSNTSTGVGENISINGARTRQVVFLLNGTHTMNVFGKSPSGSSGGQLGVEAVREFTVLTSGYSAEFGRSAGGVVNAVSKSGTNVLHGSLFEFLRNSALDAREFFDDQVPPFKRNQFGGSIGGPFRKDKTFFFSNLELLRERLGQTIVRTFPTAQARQGILPGRAPFTVAATAQPYLDLIPLPNAQDFGDGTARHIRGFSQPTDEEYFIVRIDHNFSDSDFLFGSYVYDDSRQTNAGSVPAFSQSVPYRSQYAALEENHIFTPRLLNTAHVGFNRSASNVLQDCDKTAAGLSFVPNTGCPRIEGTGFDPPQPGIGPRVFILNSFQYADTLSWTYGNHAFKFGGYYERMQLNGFQFSTAGGRYNFTSLENFLRANVRFFQANVPGLNINRGIRQNLFAVFANDSIRVRPHLTLNLGVRYEPITVPTEVNGLLANTACLTCQPRIGEPLFDNPSLKNFSPRVGLAWSPGTSQNTSIRAGFGLFFDPMLHHQWADVPFHSAPLWAEARVTSREAGGPVPFPNGFGLLSSGDIPLAPSFVFSLDGDPSPPYVMQYDFSVQRQLPRQLVVLAAYVGSVGRHLPRLVDNQAFPTLLDDGRIFFPANSTRRNPGFAEVRHRTYDTNSSYNALQLGARRRFGRGIGFQLSYTLSRSLDMLSDIGGVGDSPNGTVFATLKEFPKVDRGRSDFDARQNFSANFTADFPLGPGKALGGHLTGGAGKLLGGWQAQGIVTLQTGLPTAVLLGFDNTRFQSTRNQGRPNLNAGFTADNVVLGAPNRTRDPNGRYLDPKAFSLPEPGFLGNLGRGAFSGPGLATFDFSLIKNTSVTERIKLELRSEFFNLFNRANFGFPQQTVFNQPGQTQAIGSFATIDSVLTSARQIQFALKLLF